MLIRAEYETELRDPKMQLDARNGLKSDAPHNSDDPSACPSVRLANR